MNAKQNQKSTMQSLSKRLNVSETELLIAVKQMGLNPSEVNAGWEDAIAQHLTGNTPQTLQHQPEPEPARPDELDSLSLVSESEDLDNAADHVAQNVANGGSIRQGFIDSEVGKTAAQAELLAHLNTATFADVYRRTMAENMALFSDISDKNHDEFMGAIVEKFGQLGKGVDPNLLPRTMTEKAEQNQAKTQAYTQKIRTGFNVKSWMN